MRTTRKGEFGAKLQPTNIQHPENLQASRSNHQPGAGEGSGAASGWVRQFVRFRSALKLLSVNQGFASIRFPSGENLGPTNEDENERKFDGCEKVRA
jgi:hypothetical protein